MYPKNGYKLLLFLLFYQHPVMNSA